jgi:hypothetical protein
MKLHRSHKRPLEVTIGPADRDPRMVYRDQLLGLKAVWYDGAVTLTPPTAPVEVPSPQFDLAPLPPPDAREQKWKQVVERANEVVAMLKSDPRVDGAELLDVVCNLVDMEPTVEEIVAAYRKRM